MEGFIEVEEFYIDMESPHKLGTRSEKGNEADSWLVSSGVYSSCRGDVAKVKTIPSGVYTVFQDSNGATHARELKIRTDELYFLPNNCTTEVCKEVADFWNKAKKFEENNVTHKRGILFMGPPGTGKTSLTNLLTEALVTNGGLVFYVSSTQELLWYIEFIHRHLRIVEPDRPVITVIEDIDRFMDTAMESVLLNFLDGPESFGHHVVIGTTNKLDDLNDLIVRPSRFDWLITVDGPDEACRKAFLIYKGLEESEAVKWAKDTEGYSMAELKELFISVKLLDLGYKTSMSKIKSQGKVDVKKTFSKASKSGIGFRSGQS